MSFIYVGVGGTGSKLLESLVHLTAAGLLPSGGRALEGYLVDPDESNGNVKQSKHVAELYAKCHQLQFGEGAHLFQNTITVLGPWIPVENDDQASLESVFFYDHDKRDDPLKTDLMDLFFTAEERKQSIKRGFRGRPAMGAAVLAKTIDFQQGFWHRLRTSALNSRPEQMVSLALGGSVFGGSGAAGVPTICRLLKDELGKHFDDKKLALGLVLFLPYFTYDKVPKPQGQQDGDEVMQADPQTFATATAEALKYYEGNVLDFADAIYTVGELHPAHMPKSAVGAEEQTNPAHFVELVAALGTIRFWSGEAKNRAKGTVNLAVRDNDDTVRWQDLPAATATRASQMKRLQEFALFCVVYHYVLYPFTLKNLHSRHVVTGLLDDLPGDYERRPESGESLKNMDDYVLSFLRWMLELSTPRRVPAAAFVPGLVDVRVFADRNGDGTWRLKTVPEFKEKQVEALFHNLENKRKPDLRKIWDQIKQSKRSLHAAGAGRLIRAIHEACEF